MVIFGYYLVVRRSVAIPSLVASVILLFLF